MLLLLLVINVSFHSQELIVERKMEKKCRLNKLNRSGQCLDMPVSEKLVILELYKVATRNLNNDKRFVLYLYNQLERS